MKELESLLALNDIELNSSLEPYEQFDSSKKGPYRALQAVSILIFVIHNLIKTPSLTSPNYEPECTIWAWTCAFSFMGHIIQQCTSCGPLLPSVLVFLEWYVGLIDQPENYKDEKICNAKTYFFGALVELLNRLEVQEPETVKLALWEDHELNGFEPVVWSMGSLDFTSSEKRVKFEPGSSIRVHRVRLASMKIIDKLTGFAKIKDSEMFLRKNEVVEEEEVILFKPLTRVNSEPVNQTELVDQTETEDGLRRSTSHEPLSKRGVPYSAGPPSLSGWVVNREPKNPKMPDLAPIAEISTPYVAPIPSAPLLPEESVWLRGSSVLGAPPVSRSQEPPDQGSGFVDAYHPPVFGLSSSEWLYRYTNNLSLERANGNNIIQNSNIHRPVFSNRPIGNFNINGGSRFDVFDRWGNPLLMNRMVYFENPGFVSEEPPVLQRLKETEWRL